MIDKLQHLLRARLAERAATIYASIYPVSTVTVNKIQFIFNCWAIPRSGLSTPNELQGMDI